MKITAIIQSQSIRAVSLVKGDFGYLPDAVMALLNEFKFIKYPSKPEEIIVAPDKPIIFSHGKLLTNGRTIVIDELHCYRNGIIVITHTGTNDSDAAADYILGWAAATFQMEFKLLKPPAYLSQLEVQFDKSIPNLFPQSNVVRAVLTKLMPSFWGHPIDPLELVSMAFSVDPTKLRRELAVAPKFSIERRINVAFEENLYFSEAPLSTQDHELVLSALETAI